MKYFKELCQLGGVSGGEDSVREYIISQLGSLPYVVDNLGNVIVEKKGAEVPKKKLMLSAHMDEVGIIITSVEDNGFFKFDSVGGIDPKAILGKSLKIGEVNAVVGTVPVHLGDDEQNSKIPDIDDMYIDIGAADKAEAEKYVKAGDCAYFESDFVEYGDGFIKSKAIDDRFGCAVLLNLLGNEVPFDITVCFVTAEEVGLVGAGAAASRVKPDIAVVVESTTANDLNGVSGAQRVCVLGGGAVISFMDGRTVYDRELYSLAVNAARESGIKFQTKTQVAGGNDAGAIQPSGAGVRVAAVSLPTRGIHSPCCIAKESDMESISALIPKLIEKFGEIK